MANKELKAQAFDILQKMNTLQAEYDSKMKNLHASYNELVKKINAESDGEE